MCGDLADMAESGCVLVVMGVAGSGKSTLASRLAEACGATLLEGDDFHPVSNVERMRAGLPLDDAMRAPWLDSIGEAAADERKSGKPVVVACSALKRSYRDRLRAKAPDMRFLLLHGEQSVVAARLGARKGHFMNPGLLDSQFATLEPLQPDEAGWTIPLELTPDEIFTHARQLIGEAGACRDGAS